MALLDLDTPKHGWTFLTNHAHVLIAISRNGDLRQRDISQVVGITQGAVQRILDDLEEGGYIRRQRAGRRNRYEIVSGVALRHPLEENHTIDELLATLED
ncbi:MAG: helix-turn-helix domain-containing protein [Acidimicrobiales bacterium]